MKSRNLAIVAVMLTAALTVGTPAHGQESDKGTVANLTLKLTEQYTAPALLLKDENGKVLLEKIPAYQNEYSVETPAKYVATYEYGSKIQTYKISNKEFLEALRDQVGLIPDITGWALVMFEHEGNNTAFITKKDVYPINVSQYLYSDWGDATAEQMSYKSVYTETYSDNGYSEKETETGSYKAKFIIGVESEFPYMEMDLQGLYDESATLKTFASIEGPYTQWIPGARSVTSITGSLTYEEDDDSDDDSDDATSVITGSISIAAGKQVDRDQFPILE